MGHVAIGSYDFNSVDDIGSMRLTGGQRTTDKKQYCTINRLWMWRWSFSSVRRLSDSTKPWFVFQQWNKWEKHLSEQVQCQNVFGGIHFTKKKTWRAETLQSGSEFQIFRPRLESRTYLSMHLLADEMFFSFSLEWWSGFSECLIHCRLFNRQSFSVLKLIVYWKNQHKSESLNVFL
jgi:hypothetical protein